MFLIIKYIVATVSIPSIIIKPWWYTILTVKHYICLQAFIFINKYIVASSSIN